MNGVLYNDTEFNLALPAVLASNINGTPLQLTFPTTTTGTSTGHYTHLGVDGVGGQSDHHNLSGNKTGGFNFWNSSSIEAPHILASIMNEGVIVDKSITQPRVYSPPIESLSPDHSHINFPTGVDFTQPPYNFNQTFNPVYMTQDNGYYILNTLVYAVISGPAQIQLFNNDSFTNPIPPNVVPSDFPNTNSDGLLVGQPVFALTPFTKTSILSNILTMINDTDVSVLSATQLTFNNVPQVKNIIHQPYSPYFNNGAHNALSIPTSITNIHPYFGWYFKNTNANDYINWQLPPDNSMIVQDIYGIYLQFFNIVATSELNVTITTPVSSRTFDLTSLSTDTYYTAFINISGTCPSPKYYASVLKNVTSYITTGTYLPSQIVSSMNIITNITTVNTNQFIITKFGVITKNGTQEWLLMPA